MNQDDTAPPERPTRPQNRLLFWLAAALIPEAAAFQVESPRAMAQRAELLRYHEANDADGGHGDRHAA
jgi:hypothetical protein